jgi:beta-glucuronidase
MKALKLIPFLFFIGLLSLQSQTITNIPGRNTFSLNGKWNYIIDPNEKCYYDYRYSPYDANPSQTADISSIRSLRTAGI